MHDARQPARVLLDDGTVEPQLRAQRLVARDVGRVLAEDGLGGVAGQRLRGGEHDDRHQEQRHQAEPQAHEQQLQEGRHVTDPSCGRQTIIGRTDKRLRHAKQIKRYLALLAADARPEKSGTAPVTFGL